MKMFLKIDSNGKWTGPNGGSLGGCSVKEGAERMKSPLANTKWNKTILEKRERDRHGGRSG